MQMNPVGWFEIYVQDMDRARSFYEAVLDCRLAQLPVQGGDHPGMQLWAFPMHDSGKGATGALVHIPGCPSGSGGTIVYFSCEDCAVQLQRVLDHGGSICREKVSIGPYGFIGLAHDTEGNMFGLHSTR